MTTTEKFFALIRLGLDCEKDKDHSPAVAADEWPLLFKMAQWHGVTGVAFAGVQRLSERKPANGTQNDISLPPKALLPQWFGMAERIRKSNMLMDRQCAELTRMMESMGLDCCILKGQGLSRLYPDRGIRQTGDIDVWVKTRVANFGDSLNASFAEVRTRLSSINEGKIGKTVYHHIEWRLPDAEVEIHIRPQQLNNPFANRAFQRWCNEQWLKMGIGITEMDKMNEFNTPSIDFNTVYLLAHMYHHLLFEGLAMKQVCDYAVLLCRNEESRVKYEEIEEALRSFGMLRFSRGMMWIMQDIFHIAQETLPVRPDENEGRFILDEIIKESSITNTDTETTARTKAKIPSSSESVMTKFWRRTKYRLRFITHYPSEILWDIPFRLYHFCWRLKYA